MLVNLIRHTLTKKVKFIGMVMAIPDSGFVSDVKISTSRIQNGIR